MSLTHTSEPEEVHRNKPNTKDRGASSGQNWDSISYNDLLGTTDKEGRLVDSGPVRLVDGTWFCQKSKYNPSVLSR